VIRLRSDEANEDIRVRALHDMVEVDLPAVRPSRRVDAPSRSVERSTIGPDRILLRRTCVRRSARTIFSIPPLLLVCTALRHHPRAPACQLAQAAGPP